jgi:hypothetical protein
MSQCHAIIDPVRGYRCATQVPNNHDLLCDEHQAVPFIQQAVGEYDHLMPSTPEDSVEPVWSPVDDDQSPHDQHHTEPSGDHTNPWDNPTKIENLDMEQRLAYVQCELPGACVCDSSLAQCHVAIYGRLCRFPARRDRPYCINHDPESRDGQLAHARRASAKAAQLRRRTPGVQDIALFLGSRSGVQAAIDFLVRAEFLGQVSPTRSRNILRLLHAAIRNLGPDGRFRDDAMADYLNYREDIEAFMPDVLALARACDTPAPPPARPAANRAPAPQPPSLKKTFGELLGSRANPDFVFSFDEDEIQTPEDANRLIARMRRR